MDEWRAGQEELLHAPNNLLRRAHLLSISITEPVHSKYTHINNVKTHLVKATDYQPQSDRIKIDREHKNINLGLKALQ